MLSGGRNFGDDVLVQDAPSRLDCMGWWWGAIDAVLNSVFRVTLRRPKSSACVSDVGFPVVTSNEMCLAAGFVDVLGHFYVLDEDGVGCWGTFTWRLRAVLAGF